jgi:hypothetical protein
MTSGNDSQPYLSRLRSRMTDSAPLSSLTSLGLDLMEERRWSPLRSTDAGSALGTELLETICWEDARYRVIRQTLIALLELRELRPVDPD